MRNVVAVIPARGESKGILNKNIKDFCGKPLLAWSIEQAKAAKNISSVWVSSDSDEILEVAKRFGANVIQRPKEISGDTASSESAWLHSLSFLNECNINPDVILGIQATSPLRQPADFDAAIEKFYLEKYDSLFSCVKLSDFLFWRKNNAGDYNSYNYDYKNRGRRQDREPQFLENGSFYLFTPALLRKYDNRLGGRIGIYEMDFWKSFQIDDIEEFYFCEVVMKDYLIDHANEKGHEVSDV